MRKINNSMLKTTLILNDDKANPVTTGGQLIGFYNKKIVKPIDDGDDDDNDDGIDNFNRSIGFNSRRSNSLFLSKLDTGTPPDKTLFKLEKSETQNDMNTSTSYSNPTLLNFAFSTRYGSKQPLLRSVELNDEMELDRLMIEFGENNASLIFWKHLFRENSTPSSFSYSSPSSSSSSSSSSSFNTQPGGYQSERGVISGSLSSGNGSQLKPNFFGPVLLAASQSGMQLDPNSQVGKRKAASQQRKVSSRSRKVP